jgi:glucosamine 6-phosphate synthetase-like amidotransferase/phosphosugar isomerase protein
MSPAQLELLTAFYLTGLAVRLFRQRGGNTSLWEGGLSQLPLMVDELRSDQRLNQKIVDAIAPLVARGYDKAQVIGGGQDYPSARSTARTLRRRGFLAEALYTDSAWHGPLATVGGEDAEHDTMIIIFATDPEFREEALVDTQVYRVRNAPVVLIAPEKFSRSSAVRGVDPLAVIDVPEVPRPFIPLTNSVIGALFAARMDDLWAMAPR